MTSPNLPEKRENAPESRQNGNNDNTPGRVGMSDESCLRSRSRSPNTISDGPVQAEGTSFTTTCPPMSENESLYRDCRALSMAGAAITSEPYPNPSATREEFHGYLERNRRPTALMWMFRLPTYGWTDPISDPEDEGDEENPLNRNPGVEDTHHNDQGEEEEKDRPNPDDIMEDTPHDDQGEGEDRRNTGAGVENPDQNDNDMAGRISELDYLPSYTTLAEVVGSNDPALRALLDDDVEEGEFPAIPNFDVIHFFPDIIDASQFPQGDPQIVVFALSNMMIDQLDAATVQDLFVPARWVNLQVAFIQLREAIMPRLQLMLPPEDAQQVMEESLRTWIIYCRHLEYLFVLIWNCLLGRLHGMPRRLTAAVVRHLQTSDKFHPEAWFYDDFAEPIKKIANHFDIGWNGMTNTREYWEREFALLRDIASEIGSEIVNLFNAPFDMQPQWDMFPTGHDSEIPVMPTLPTLPFDEASAGAIVAASEIDFDSTVGEGYVPPFTEEEEMARQDALNAEFATSMEDDRAELGEEGVEDDPMVSGDSDADSEAGGMSLS